MRTVRPELGLERLLLALERDLLAATDQEILEAANEIGINPTQKGSAALFGVTITTKRIQTKRLRSAENDERRAETSPRARRRSKRGTPPAD